MATQQKKDPPKQPQPSEPKKEEPAKPAAQEPAKPSVMAGVGRTTTSGSGTIFTWPDDRPLELRARLAQKILMIYEDLDYIQKKNVNQQQGYKFVSEGDFAERMNEACRKAKVVLIPSFPHVELSSVETDSAKGKRLVHTAVVRGTFTVIDAETGWSEKFDMPGVGQDFSDKAIYKALTGAQKYAYYKFGLCATGNDPEEDTTETRLPQSKPAQTQQPRPSQAQGQPAQTQQKPTEQPKQTQKPAEKPAEKPKEDTQKTMNPPQDTSTAPKTQTPPKETPSSGTPEGSPSPLKGSGLGIITQVVPPKGPQKSGQVTFAVNGGESLNLWFWVERLNDGTTLADLQAFASEKTPVEVVWDPDVTNRWRILQNIRRTDMPELGDQGYDDQAAEHFQQPQ